ncbi:hypothetical protein [Prosthecomicrobium hirschii]|uniref:hypothetical protein n=1 Tax=Prosthecodimorpha hirschii TaxID=665126 RepID=UPI00221ED154|nr:hypothetical protein [Prosthecomicrobium hirschii]MCW1842923.1 hypothetical protein [Prosthecomicrobium hirschii]
MIPFNSDTLEVWLSDYEAFNYDFKRFCFLQFRAFSVRAKFVPNMLREAHTEWVRQRDSWLAVEAHPETEELSHIKVVSLLLTSLNRYFIESLYEHEYNEDEKVHIDLPSREYQSAREDLIAVPEAILAFDFCLNIIYWYEFNRVDRSAPFESRLTADMRHDIITYLVNGGVDPKAVYLILKALFNRANEGGAAN